MKNEKQKYHTVYETTNLINGNTYIGVHVTNDPYDSYLGSGLAMTRAIKSHGRENFEKAIIAIYDTLEESYLLEAMLVDEEYVKREDTYNLCLGGGKLFAESFNSVVVRQETRDKISRSRKGNKSSSKAGKCKTIIVETGEILLDIRDTLRHFGINHEFRYKFFEMILNGTVRFVDEVKQEETVQKLLLKQEHLRIKREEWRKRSSERMTGRKNTPESIEKTKIGTQLFYENNPDRKATRGKHLQDPEVRQKAAANRVPLVWTDEMRLSHSIKRKKYYEESGEAPGNKNKKQIINHTTQETTYISDEEEIPVGWEYGSFIKGIKRGVMYNNGVDSKIFKPDDVIPDGWVIGRFNNRTWYYSKEERTYKSFSNDEEIPPGWTKSTRKKHQQ